MLSLYDHEYIQTHNTPSIRNSSLSSPCWSREKIGTNLEIDKTVHNFGDILHKSGPVSCTFTVTNTGSQPAVIYNVVSTCGCTDVQWTKSPIRPGETGKISVTYSNDEGAYPFDKTLTTYISDSKKPVLLKVRGVSIEKVRPLNELYPVQYGPLAMKDTEYKVGEQFTDETETTITLTENDCYRLMRRDCNRRYNLDRCDIPTFSLEVEFLNLGDTEEYAALKGLESVLLYDTVTVRNEEINLSLQLYVSEWEWDAIRQKITALKLVNTTDYKKGSVTGYNVQSKSISSEKLMDEVKEEIVGQVVDIIPEYADPQASRPATVTVTDGDQTLAWGTRSKVGTVQGNDLHVTMPVDPALQPPTGTVGISGVFSDPAFGPCYALIPLYLKGKTASNISITSATYYDSASHDITSTCAVAAVTDYYINIRTSTAAAAGKYANITISIT